MSDRAAPPARPLYEMIIKTIALRGWSKTTLSERSGISRSTIDNWKRNPRSPQASAVNAVADTLGIAREQAHELAGIMPPAGRAHQRQAHSTVPVEVLAVIRKNYPVGKQQEIIDMLEELSAPAEEAPSGHDGPDTERAG